MKVLVATHGTLAMGFASASKIIIGECDHLYTYTAYVDSDENVEEELKMLIGRLSHDDQLIILTDILGGSVNTIAMSEMLNENVYLVSGVNLGLLLQLLLFPKEKISRQELKEIVEESKKGVLLIDSEGFLDEDF